VGGVGHQHVQVRAGAREPGVELLVGGGHLRLARPRRLHPSQARGQAFPGPRLPGGMAIQQAGEGERKGGRLLRLELEAEARGGLGQVEGGRLAAEAQAPGDPVQPPVAQLGPVGPGRQAQGLARALPAHPAHLEDVREVGLEGQGQDEVDLLQAVVGDPERLVAGPLVQEGGAEDVDQPTRQEAVLANLDVGIGEVHGEEDVVVPDRGAEQKGAHAGQPELQPGEESGPVVVEPLLPQAQGDDVARVVEDGEGVPVLEHSGPLVRPRGGRQDVVLVLQLDDVFHATASPHQRATPGARPAGIGGSARRRIRRR